jgi:hypothetical protein
VSRRTEPTFTAEPKLACNSPEASLSRNRQPHLAKLHSTPRHSWDDFSRLCLALFATTATSPPSNSSRPETEEFTDPEESDQESDPNLESDLLESHPNPCRPTCHASAFLKLESLLIKKESEALDDLALESPLIHFNHRNHHPLLESRSCLESCPNENALCLESSLQLLIEKKIFRKDKIPETTKKKKFTQFKNIF